MTASPNLIGIGAGLVAAVLFASLSNGSVLAFMLFYLMPLPVMLAGIGWAPRAALIATATAGLLLALLLDPLRAVAFCVFVGVPSLIISYLMSLHREVGAPGAEADGEDSGQSRIEWYPLGRVVAWTAVIAGGLVIVGLFLLGGGSESYREAVRTIFENSGLSPSPSATGPDVAQAELDRLVALFSRFVLPFFAGAVWLLVFVGNLWLAAKSAVISGLLVRPPLDLTRIDYPPFLLGGFLAALVLSVLPGQIGMAGMAFLGAFAGAFLILGLAVLHVLLEKSQFKVPTLILLYLGLLIGTPWIAPPVIVLGLAEPFFQLRQRHWRRTMPPGGNSGLNI